MEMSTQLGEQLVAVLGWQRVGEGLEAAEVVLGEWVQARAVHVVPSVRILSTVSRKRLHSTVKSWRARRPLAVMA